MRKKLTKKISAVAIAAVLALTLAACSGSESVVSSEQTSTDVPSTSAIEVIIVNDREGKELIVPKNLESIVSMAPSITQTLIHLGLADKIVAVDTYSVGLEGLPEGIPAFDMMAPDTESIAVLKPDLMLVNGMSKADGDDPFQAIVDLGVTMSYIPSSESIEDIKKDIEFIGEITSTSEKAQAIVDEMQSEIDAIVEKVANATEQKTVYFEISPAPYCYSFGNGTFLNEMIELLGATNVLVNEDSWVSVSEEQIINHNPDVIFTNVNYVENPVEEIEARTGWEAVNAVKNNEVYVISANPSSLPNEYITIALQEMAQALYPDLFA